MHSFVTQDLAHLHTEISARLQEQQPEAAKKLVMDIVLCPEARRQWLPVVERKFRKGAQLEVVIEVLWDNRDPVLNDMFAVGHFMQFCTRADVYDHFGPLFRSWIATESTPDFTFSEYGTFGHFPKLTSEQKLDFANAKYRRWRDFASPDFFRAVDGFSVFATISPQITELLFGNRNDKGIALEEWMRDLRTAETSKHLLADASTILKLRKMARKRALPPLDRAHYPPFPEFAKLIDVERGKSFFAGLDVSKGLLLCTIHDGHLVLAKRCAAVCMPERYLLATNAKGPNRIDVGAHASAFQAVKILRNKKMLLMVADARRAVQQSTETNILGIPIAFADGAPTIAFESGCATGWYTVARDGDRFMPVCVVGPSRKEKESFVDFKERWWNFYAAQIEDLFTGHPRNITLAQFWPKVFIEGSAPIREKGRRQKHRATIADAAPGSGERH
jgi:hypothetical protein